MRSIFGLVAIVVAGMPCSVVPAAAGVAEGRAIAQRWCASCHVVSQKQSAGVEGVPSFAVIASTRTDQAIGSFLFDPHPPMAGLALTRSQIADLIAYIKSQKP
jgi:mono/diheme cytochrome c family protein